MKKHLFIYALIIVSFLILVFFVCINLFKNSGTGQNQGPTPTVPKGGEAVSTVEKPNAEEQKIIDQNRLVGSLTGELPYKGYNFTLYYSYSTDTFIAYINPKNTNAGERELAVFLANRGIKDKAWLGKFFETYILPASTP